MLQTFMRLARRLRWPLAGATIAALGLSAAALGGSGIGGIFNLGQTNTVDATSSLVGISANSMLDVRNNGTGANSNGIVGRTASTLAPALAGIAGGSGIGARGTSASGSGLYGQSTSGIGVRAIAAGSNPSLKATNTGTGPAGAFEVGSGVTPFTVNSSTKVANLNADKLDALDSTDFLRNTVPLSLTGSTASAGVISGTNTGDGNGLQGVTSAAGASGVYGENDGAGYGVAGRANAPGGVGVYAEATGGGPGLAIHTLAGAAPMSVDSSAKVVNLNADTVDGASILSNRIVSTTVNDHIIQLPGFGDFNVTGCDHTNASFQWSSGGPNAYVTWYDVFNPGDSFQGVANIVSSLGRSHHFATVQLARNTGGSTSMATVTVTTNGADCVFAAQAVVQPG